MSFGDDTNSDIEGSSPIVVPTKNANMASVGLYGRPNTAASG